jgi:hypothetical protein
VRGAHNLRPCDDDLPLIALVDDLYEDIHLKALEQTGILYKIMSWYNVIGIAYSNVARHAMLAHHANSFYSNPLFGLTLEMQLGIRFHIDMA